MENDEQKSEIDPTPETDEDVFHIDETGQIEPPESEPETTEPANADAEEPAKKPENHGSKFARFKAWYVADKKRSIPATVVLLIILLGLIPATRYGITGIALKKNMSVVVKDAKTQTPVSGAQVSIGSVTANTNASGVATLPHISVGPHKLNISKTYYQTRSADVVVPILKQKTQPTIAFTATGRQVKVTLKNLISGQAIIGAKITFDNTFSVTDSKGVALAVVPEGTTSKEVSVSAKGFNDKKAQVLASDTETKETVIKLTPAGQIYFLSKLSGKIDVVKTDLDGSGRKTVLAGTGKEDDRNTILLASRDWQFLALLSSREGTTKVYIINTNDDNLITMDEGDADFTPIGWHDHYFVYSVSRHGYQTWQPNAFSIKSYNADSGKILTLANTSASGSSTADAQYENFWQIELMGNDVVYTRTWYKYPGYISVDGKQNTVSAIHPDGTNSRIVKGVDSNGSYVTNLRLNKPHELEFSIYNQTSNNTTTYTLDKNGTLNQAGSENDFNNEQISYLQAPTANQTFWQEERDGKNTLFVGDQDGGNPKQVASLSDYSTYGWYSDSYLLVSKNGSELYIIPVSGITSDSSAVKITDYHKPAQNFYGYGGGYGGL